MGSKCVEAQLCSPAKRLLRRYGGTGPTQLAVQLRRSKHLPIPAGLAYADASREDLAAGSSAASATQQTLGSAGAAGAGASAGSASAGAQVQALGLEPWPLPCNFLFSPPWMFSGACVVLMHALALGMLPIVEVRYIPVQQANR